MSEPVRVPDGVPTIPLLTPPAQQAMAVVAAMRQASVDTGHLRGVYLGYTWGQQDGGALAVVVQATDAVSGVVVWEQPYDGRGHRLTGGLSLRLR